MFASSTVLMKLPVNVGASLIRLIQGQPGQDISALKALKMSFFLYTE